MLTEEQLHLDHDRLMELVANIEREDQKRGEKIKVFLSSKIGEEFLTAPASSKEAYHCAFPGGLLNHSLRVTDHLMLLADALAPRKFSPGVLSFVGLFHDLGKVGDGVQPHYVPTRDDWKKKRGEPYEVNRECAYMPSSERGLFILQKMKISLSYDEYLAIRLNDGQYVEENRPYRLKEPQLALLVHWADRWSMDREKELFPSSR